MSNRNSRSEWKVVLILFIGFGPLLFILVQPFIISLLIPFYPMIFISIFMIAAAYASSGKSRRCKPEQKNYDQNHYKQVPRVNPYIVRGAVRNNVQTLLVEDYKPIEPIKTKALFCQFCGTRIDKDARFCHQCGSKLE
ncbi:hypothetical protein ES708_01132 [subsurface metagenome]